MRTFFQSFKASPDAAPKGIARFFRTPLVDLGRNDTRLSGIYMPAVEVGAEKIGLSDQFLANANQYATRYAASDDATMILRAALGEINWRPGRRQLTILDLGTGSGANSVIPCLRIFDGCTIVATDLSHELLALLKQYLQRETLSDRVYCVCTDAMRDHFKPERFDVVVGSAILHHLIDPQVAIDTAFSALKPGGIALFVEPFEGASVLGHAFKRMLAEEERWGRPLAPQTKVFLNAICVDLAARKGTDKSDIRFRYMDDKWLFTRTYLEAASKRAGFKKVTIVPYLYPDAGKHYRLNTEVLLRCSGIDPATALPDWAWSFIDELDQLFSPEMKRDAMIEGTIVLEK